MIYELRFYRAMPGKMNEMLDRFEKIVLGYWDKHGIRQVGFWTTTIGACHLEMFHMLAWESLDERERKWAAFSTDPQWLAQFKETEKGGVVVASLSNTILTPTRFSALR
ncbi:NIPSNAP family protein [Rhodoferax sediminis]|uniref:NIPSNAP family protein n=1 Tax=Rhodoferax sediminis TaxID=2509614 RepID=A0A515DE28_9BURK|nr:NIPSNAP family protein [Rhodoferax sediminis]QDL38666.1 NIPSNAP family protein [Rhodoferax sediminis]